MSEMREWWRSALLGTFAFACGATQERTPQPVPSATPMPTASAPMDAGAEATADAAIEVATPSRPSTPSAPELSKERQALAEKLARAPWVIRGRVREAKQVVEQRAGGAVRYQYAIVDVLEWVVGDAKGVLKAYTKSFPIWNLPMPVMLSKSPADNHRDPALELMGRAGEERLFLVRLPSESNLGWGEPGPPPFIVKRWGKYFVPVEDHLALDAREEIAATRKDLERRAAWIRDNAEHLLVRDRFQGASTQAVARAVADFAAAQLRERAKLKVELGSPTESVSGEMDVVRFPLTGDPDASGTFSVSVSRATRRVRSFHLDVPHVKNAQAGERTSSDATVKETKAALGIRSEGGELFGDATQPSRGDGLTYWRVVLHAGHVQGSHLGTPARTVLVSVTRGSGVAFEYSNGWAAETDRAAPAEPP